MVGRCWKLSWDHTFWLHLKAKNHHPKPFWGVCSIYQRRYFYSSVSVEFSQWAVRNAMLEDIETVAPSWREIHQIDLWMLFSISFFFFKLHCVSQKITDGNRFRIWGFWYVLICFNIFYPLKHRLCMYIYIEYRGPLHDLRRADHSFLRMVVQKSGDASSASESRCGSEWDARERKVVRKCARNEMRI